MKPGEIRAMSEAAISNEIADTQKKVLELRCAIALGDAVNPAQLKTMKKNIARLNTISSEKKSASNASNKGAN